MGLFTKKYKFTDKKISRGGILSSLFAVIALVLIIVGVYLSYKARGNGDMSVGLLGMGAALISVAGLIIGVKSFKQEDIFLGFPWFGVVSNALLCIFMLCVILIGI